MPSEQKGDNYHNSKSGILFYQRGFFFNVVTNVMTF